MLIKLQVIKEQVFSLITKIEEILDKRKSENVEFEVQQKGKANYVTKYDVAIENLLKVELKKILPESSFLGEESGGTIGDGYTWIVDPIDGTTNFIHGLPFAVAIALVYDKETVLGVVYDGTTRDIFSAIKNQGAFKNDNKLQASCRDTIANSVLAFGFPYDITKTESILKKVLDVKLAGAADVKRIGPAALDICRVATGQYDSYFEYDLQPWDIAASILILREAGGDLIKMDGTPFTYEKSSILATNLSRKLQQELLNKF